MQPFSMLTKDSEILLEADLNNLKQIPKHINIHACL